MQRARLICSAIFGLAVIALSFHVHREAGLTLPTPWNDEAWHAWEGHAVAETGGVLSPEINPDRPTIFKGHGYSYFLGLVFKLFGFSLETARWSSWACTVAILIGFLVLYGRMPMPWLSYPIVGAYFLGSSYVVAGNIVREDALTIALAVAAYVLLQREQVFKAACIASLAVLVHPNGLYFLLPLLAVLVYEWVTRGVRLKQSDVVLAIVCGACVAASACLVISNWTHFMSDFFGAGLGVQSQRDPAGSIASPGSIVAYLWFGILFAAAYFLDRRWMIPLTFGLCCLAPPILNQEMWYAVYRVTAFMTLIVVTVQMVALLGRRVLPATWSVAPGVAGIACALPLLVFSLKHGFIEGPRGYPADMTWGWGMRMEEAGVPYLEQGDVDAVAGLLRLELASVAEPVAEFHNLGADSLFFKAALQGIQVRHRVYTEHGGHVIVFHVSRYQPSWFQSQLLEAMTSRGVDLAQPAYVRHETEKWYILRTSKPRGIAGQQLQNPVT